MTKAGHVVGDAYTRNAGHWTEAEHIVDNAYTQVIGPGQGTRNAHMLAGQNAYTNAYTRAVGPKPAVLWTTHLCGGCGVDDVYIHGIGPRQDALITYAHRLFRIRICGLLDQDGHNDNAFSQIVRLGMMLEVVGHSNYRRYVVGCFDIRPFVDRCSRLDVPRIQIEYQELKAQDQGD